MRLTQWPVIVTTFEMPSTLAKPPSHAIVLVTLMPVTLRWPLGAEEITPAGGGLFTGPLPGATLAPPTGMLGLPPGALPIDPPPTVTGPLTLDLPKDRTDLLPVKTCVTW